MRPLGTFGICVLTGGKSPTVGGRGFIMGVGAGGTVITVRDCTLADSAAKSIVMMQCSPVSLMTCTVERDAAARRELTSQTYFISLSTSGASPPSDGFLHSVAAVRRRSVAVVLL